MFKLTATLHVQMFFLTHVYIMTTTERVEGSGGGRCVAISRDSSTFTRPIIGADENRDPFAQILIK